MKRFFALIWLLLLLSFDRSGFLSLRSTPREGCFGGLCRVWFFFFDPGVESVVTTAGDPDEPSGGTVLVLVIVTISSFVIVSVIAVLT